MDIVRSSNDTSPPPWFGHEKFALVRMCAVGCIENYFFQYLICLCSKNAKNEFQIRGLELYRKGPEDSADPFISQKKSFSKVPFLGTLNLYLVTPDALQKTKKWSDHLWLRKHLKTLENWTKSNIVIFLQFLGVFSAQDDRTNFSSFPLDQASQDTSFLRLFTQTQSHTFGT